jgi:protein tyrosine phosphatase type 4A
MTLATQFTTISLLDKTFVIFDSPAEWNVNYYLSALKKLGVKIIVRTCGASYDKKTFEDEGIIVEDLLFTDGGFPDNIIIRKWLKIINMYNIIGIHCVSGMGRSPTLLAIGLIEKGMDNIEVIEHIKWKRRGSFSDRQLQAIIKYKPISKTINSGCIIA